MVLKKVLILLLIFVATYFINSLINTLDSNNRSTKGIATKLVWYFNIENKKDLNEKIKGLKTVLSYNSEYLPAYDKACEYSKMKKLNSISKSNINLFISQLRKKIEDPSFKLVLEKSDLYKYIDCVKLYFLSFGNENEALSLLKTVYNDESEPFRKAEVFNEIKKLMDSINLKRLDSLLTIYRNRYLEYPEDLSKLVITGLIDKIPEEPYGGQYYISEDRRIRSTSNRH